MVDALEILISAVVQFFASLLLFVPLLALLWNLVLRFFNIVAPKDYGIGIYR